MDTQQQMAALLELQKLVSRKADLAITVAGIYARERSYHLELDLRRSIHSVGGARARWNESGHIAFMQEQYHRDEEEKAEYREVCEQIKLLEAMLAEHLPEFVFPQPV